MTFKRAADTNVEDTIIPVRCHTDHVSFFFYSWLLEEKVRKKEDTGTVGKGTREKGGEKMERRRR